MLTVNFFYWLTEIKIKPIIALEWQAQIIHNDDRVS